MLTPVRRFLGRLGVDRAIGTTVITRVGQAGSSLILMLLVASRLSGVKQGYYVTFNSVVALQVFFELGLTFVLLQFSSHEVARLIQQTDGTYQGDYNSKARLSSLLHFGTKWYAFAALLLLVVVLPTGYWFFLTSYNKGRTEGWQIPWTILVFATAGTLLTNAVIAIFEGCGHVAQVASLRLRETLVGTLAAAFILISGAGLYAVASLVVCDFLVEALWLYRRRSTILDLWKAYDRTVLVDWKVEVWPFQWKIAVSWLSGYFIFQIFNPILFRMVNPVEAGRMGLTTLACSGLTALAMAWITTKAPKMGSLIALRKREELDSMFFRAAKSAIGVALVMAIGFWSLVVFAQAQGVSLALRFLGPLALGLMLISSTVNCITFAQAQYLRAHKVEPFLLQSVVAALSNVGLALLLVGQYGATGVAAGYAFTTIVVGVGGGTYIFTRSRKQWAAKIADSRPDSGPDGYFS